MEIEIKIKTKTNIKMIGEMAMEVRDLNVAYQKKVVLWDASFGVPLGRLCAMIGPNGAGKSTALKACLGLVAKSSGRVLFFGETYERVRRRVAYVPQRESVDWDFPVSALEVVVMGLYREVGWCLPVRKKHRQAALEALVQVGLADYAHRQISQLSGGQQQRVFLARALVQRADLYLMDEPFASVDAATERAIVEVLRALRAEGKTVLCVHHDLESVREYFEHVVMINMRVTAEGPVREVFHGDNLRKTYGDRWQLIEDTMGELRAEHLTEGRQ